MTNSGVEEQVLLAVIYNDLEDYDESRPASHWKVNSTKVNIFAEKIAEMTKKQTLREIAILATRDDIKQYSRIHGVYVE
jgi:hypothetical protein